MHRKNQGFRIGCYIRVSTEEQAQNLEGSIKNQEERLKAHVKLKNMESHFGEIKEIFIDRAKSGKDTNRPELQKLLKAIRAKEIDLVLVTELSRISRSMKDFAEIWELMQKSNCGFQSLRENFDTTTAAGEMVLFSVANIAQFERRQVSERVSANINARAKRGLYNGGCVSFGYELIEGKPGYLKINKKKAKVVKKAFEMFLKEETLQKTAKWLNDNGYRLERIMSGGGRNMRLDFFTVDNLHHMLRNKIYIGVKTYKENGKECGAKAVWEPIVERRIFNKVQKILGQNKSRKKPHSNKRYPYLLTGISFCEKCGDHLSGKSAWGKAGKIGYYEHSWSTKRNSILTKKTFDCGGPRRFLARKLEELVVGEVEKLISQGSFAKELLIEAKKVHESCQGVKETERLKAEIYGFSSQLEALAERLSQLPKSVSATPIFKQMEKVELAKAKSEKQLEDLKRVGSNASDPPIGIKSYSAFLSSLRQLVKSGDPEIKAKIIKRLIHRIEVGEREVKVYFNVDESSLLREPMYLGSRIFLCPKQGKVIEFPQKDATRPFRGGASAESAEFLNFSIRECSNSLTFGAPRGT
ncbi:MAG: recombinase family protein [Bdellovibrionaceae bacterium]|nr:recombinase family protein [Pseudobdellovibrionaceae bacterium]MCB9093232.1 recombinase family protein [Halobacteriovoraceae bacterium]